MKCKLSTVVTRVNSVVKWYVALVLSELLNTSQQYRNNIDAGNLKANLAALYGLLPSLPSLPAVVF